MWKRQNPLRSPLAPYPAPRSAEALSYQSRIKLTNQIYQGSLPQLCFNIFCLRHWAMHLLSRSATLFGEQFVQKKLGILVDFLGAGYQSRWLTCGILPHVTLNVGSSQVRHLDKPIGASSMWLKTAGSPAQEQWSGLVSTCSAESCVWGRRGKC